MEWAWIPEMFIFCLRIFFRKSDSFVESRTPKSSQLSEHLSSPIFQFFCDCLVFFCFLWKNTDASMQSIDELEMKRKGSVTYTVFVVLIVLLEPSEGVGVHGRNVQGRRVVRLTQSGIQLCVYIELLGAGEDLGLEVGEAQIAEDRIGLDVASEGVWAELHCHFNEGHGEGNPMLRLLSGYDSRSSPELDAAKSVLLTRENVPCSILVRTDVVDNVVPASIVDMVKDGLVSTPSTMSIQWECNGNGHAKVALAKAENSVLP